ncbi:MAG: DUF2585 family protein [bacterium]|nr:DUF2585 family protein [bacterium]
MALSIAIVFLALQAAVLFAMGQPPISTSGEVHLWWGTVLSSGNSQHLTDWYTFSHIIHGFLFYLGLWYFFPRMSVWTRFLIALGIEIAWELIENTPMVIQHYREQALAQGYTGDSIINSVSDTLAMVIGFVMARRLPVWTIVVIGLGLELFVGFMIRDNLTLNILNLIHQFPAISAWQAGG